MGFLWEDSTGARAVNWLRERGESFVVDTITFAEALEVKPGALHQLLANAVKLRYIKKVYGRGPCVGWKLGAAGDSMTIERRKAAAPLTDEELARRRAANARRRQRADGQREPEAPRAPAIAWPPGFISTWSAPAERYEPPRIAIDEPDPAELEAAPLASWLRGLIASPPPTIVETPAEPKPEQLPLFDPAEVGPGGRARWRALDLELPLPPPKFAAPRWRQTTFLEA